MILVIDFDKKKKRKEKEISDDARLRRLKFGRSRSPATVVSQKLLIHW
jgi:hypothetical protein